MSSIYKNFTANDVANTRTLLHESIPVTGTVVSGTYSDNNIKNYSHGMFQSVYDYPYLSSSANQVFDITFGYSSGSSLSSSAAVQNSKKINIYTELAQVLVGHDHTGSVRTFPRNGNANNDTGTKIKEAVFLNFNRLLTKDEMKKGSFTLVVYTGSATSQYPTNALTISDYGAANTYFTNSPAGEYGILYTASAAAEDTGVGLIYYQAGIAVISASVFNGRFGLTASVASNINTGSINYMLTGTEISNSCNGFRHRMKELSFNNTTELNSTIYFCRANNNEFNYSSNPSYLSSSKMVVKSKASDPPVSYITTIGLYSADKELLAIAKLSEPLKKDPTNELTLRVRLDF